jgi:TPR repeat protein
MNAEPTFAIERPAQPYPGLRPFEANEWSIFFGRERMIDEVIERLALNGLVLIHGASGSGKSSLVRAGVMPKLERQHQRRGSPWLTCAMRPSGGPLWNLAAEFARLEGRADDAQRIAAIVGQFNTRDASLASVAAGFDALAGKGLCVLVDQFEELFRFEKQTSREEAEVFVDLMVRAATAGESAPGGTDVHVVVTMRSEFLGECARFDGLAETINHTQYLVPRMDDDAMMRAVRRPAMLYGGSVDEDLARRLIGPVRGRLDELPLLQHGLMLMWAEGVKRTPPGQPIALDGAIVEKAHGLAGLLSEHADAVMGAVAPDPERARIVERVFRELTDVNAEGSAIRRPRRFSDLAAAAGASPGQLRSILDAFRAPDVAFLTPYAPAPIEATTEIDISHEALIRNWRRVGSGKDGWLKLEFDDGLAWRSLLIEAQAFEKDPYRVLSAAATKDRSRLYAMHSEPWSLRYGGGWAIVGGLLDASRKAAARARTLTLATMASIAGLALIAAVTAALMTIESRKERAAVALAKVEEASLQEKEVNLKEALNRETMAVSLEQDEEAKLQAEAANLQEALTQKAEEERQLKESNEQSKAQITLTGMIFVQLTDSGRKCPTGISANADLVEKARLAAERGNGNAGYLLGMLFQCGLGVEQSIPQAIAWHEKAAKSGNPEAMRMLGLFYERGEGVALNYAKARDLLERAAEAGDASAMVELGYLYESGYGGVAKDSAKARQWFDGAAAAGEPLGMEGLGNLYEDGLGVQPDINKAYELYDKAAVAGDAGAMRRLGVLYTLGKAVPRDKVKGHEWYQKAAAAGDTEAKLQLEDFDFLPELEAIRNADVAENYAEAVRLETKLAREIEADERRKTRSPGPRTGRALGGLAFDELMIGDFSSALDAAIRARQLAPDETWIEVNHAHALMFLDRPDEAKVIYHSHRDEDDIGLGLSNWRQSVLDDFADFRRRNLNRPLMQEIEADFMSGGN